MLGLTATLLSANYDNRREMATDFERKRPIFGGL